MPDPSLMSPEELKRAFERYYGTDLLPILREVEKERLFYLRRFKILLACLVFTVIGLIEALSLLKYSLFSDNNNGWLLIPLFIGVYILRGPYHKYYKTVKENAMGRVVEFLDGFQYFYQRDILRTSVSDNPLIREHFDDRILDDSFCGTYKGAEIRVSEEKLDKYDYDSKGNRRTSTIFDGIFVELEFLKPFEGKTLILKDSGIFNKFKTLKRDFSDLKRVALEDVVFEKIFEVYSTDQIEARCLLTPAFMERLLKLRDIYGGQKIESAFWNNRLLIAISTKENMFEACSFFKSNLNKKRVMHAFDQICTVLSIVDVLKLGEKTPNFSETPNSEKIF